MIYLIGFWLGAGFFSLGFWMLVVEIKKGVTIGGRSFSRAKPPTAISIVANNTQPHLDAASNIFSEFKDEFDTWLWQFAQNRAQKRRRASIKATARKLRKKLIKEITMSGHAYILKKEGTRVRFSMINIRLILYTDDAIYFKVTKRPYTVQFTDLATEEMEINLSAILERQVKIFLDDKHGLWVRVGLASGIDDIPTMFAWQGKDKFNAMSLLPKTRKWNIPIGAGTGRTFIHKDIRDMPHLLVAGTTDGGKSVFLRQLIATLISRNTPKDMELVLIDLKGGVEFWPMRTLPHLRREVCIKSGQVVDALTEMMQEKDRRMDMMRESGVANIREWNKRNKNNKMHYIFIIFDEIGALMTDKKARKACEPILDNIITQARGAGIHAILCTQYPHSNVVSTTIKANITERICFRTDSNGSQVVIGNWDATYLSGKGRGIYASGATHTVFQGPFIDDDEYNEIINDMDGRKLTEHEEDIAFILKSAWLNHNHVLSHAFIKEIKDNVKTMGKVKIENFVKANVYNYDKQEPVLDDRLGRKYIIVKDGNSRSPKPTKICVLVGYTSYTKVWNENLLNDEGEKEGGYELVENVVNYELPINWGEVEAHIKSLEVILQSVDPFTIPNPQSLKNNNDISDSLSSNFLPQNDQKEEENDEK